MQIIAKYFSLTDKQAEQFMQLSRLYGFWNERINVISRKDIRHLYLHHVLHSLAIARVVRFIPGTVIIDAGTGGGLPGIPLAILFPEVHFILADSIAKKISVVDAIIRDIGLHNTETRNMRLEDLRDIADFVVCRAVTGIPRLYGWIKNNISPEDKNELRNGLLALKGGDLAAELKSMGPGVQVFDLKDYFEEDFFMSKKLVHVVR